MSIEDLEKKIADLEQSNLDAQQSIASVIELNRGLVDLQKILAGQLFNWMVALDNRNSEALELLKQTLPDGEARRKLGDLLARGVFDRDQLEAMIKKLELFRLSHAPPGS